jgi:hypothetical protein
MTCTCTEPDGSLSPFCRGCTLNGFINPGQQVRAQEDKFSSAQMDQLRLLLAEAKIDRIWIIGFERGFQLARDIYED